MCPTRIHVAPWLPRPLVAQQQRMTSANGLSIEDAWAIALQWQDVLRDKVLLVRTPDESVRVAKSYEWIYFAIDIHNRDEVSAARAAAVTWFALSCCRGYGGNENPVFWKCVFSEVARANIGLNNQSIQSITDAHGFFDGDGVDFPRFKLKVYGAEANVLLFLGAPGEEVEADDKATLSQIMESLAPWIDQARTSRRSEVSLDGVYSSYSLAKRDEITKLEAQRPQEWPLSRFISESNRYAGSGWPSPVFVVKELNLNGGFFMEDSTKQQWLLDIMRSHDAEIQEFSCASNRDVARDALASIVSGVLGLPGSGARARTKSFSLHNQDACTLPALASALPKTTSIGSVTIDCYHTSNESFEQTVIMWIGYALFHPDTPTTPWKSLVLKHTALREQSVAALQAMSRGNNLMAMLEGREPTSDGYYRARLAANAVVYGQDGSLITERSQQTVIITSDGSLEVEVCDVASEDAKQWREWVAVVVPAYGVGWIRSADVTTVVKRAPAKASLSQFGVSDAWRTSQIPQNLAGVLSLIGRRLVHLDFRWFAHFASQADFLHALGFCPSLESLGLKYRPDMWGRELVARVLPHLRELELCVREHDSEAAQLDVFAVPRGLRVLRINVVDTSHGVFGRGVHAIRHILSEPSELRVFHWKDGLRKSHHPTPYEETCFDTARRLKTLEIPHECIECVEVRLPAACAAAFLSVIAQAEDSSALSQLDMVMVMVIVRFAGSRAKRAIVLEPAPHEVPHQRQHNPITTHFERRLHDPNFHIDHFGPRLWRSRSFLTRPIAIRGDGGGANARGSVRASDLASDYIVDLLRQILPADQSSNLTSSENQDAD